MVTCRIFLIRIFLQTGGLKKKREAVKWPKSREVFNSCQENHMYARPLDYKTFFMLNSVEYEILNVCKYEKNQEIWLFFRLRQA